MKNIFKTIRKHLVKPKKYEVIRLPAYHNVKFKVYNQVEKFRVQDYGSEEEALEYLVGLVVNGDVFYDIGASIGLVTITSAIKNRNGLIVSFEPDQETYQRLNENIKFNKLTNVQPLNIALSDSVGVLELYTNGTDGYSPSLKYQKIWDGINVRKVEIQTTTIDKLIESKKIPLPDILKIDIEGAEEMCIKGALRLLKGEFVKKPREIFLEAHPDYLPAFNSSEEEIVKILTSCQYKLVKRTSSHNQVHLHFNFS